jgi:hypothetical protein
MVEKREVKIGNEHREGQSESEEEGRQHDKH